MHQIVSAFALLLVLCLLFVSDTTAFQILSCPSPSRQTNILSGLTIHNLSSSAADTGDDSVGNSLRQSSVKRGEASTGTSRRDMFTISVNTIALSLAFATQYPASSSALESRNESVCGTGLFEHFQEWRCTPIGNILDEGSSKDLKDVEVASIDSLMGKLGVNMDDLNGMDADSEKDGKKRKGSKGKPKDSK